MICNRSGKHTIELKGMRSMAVSKSRGGSWNSISTRACTVGNVSRKPALVAESQKSNNSRSQHTNNASRDSVTSKSSRMVVSLVD